MSDSKEIQVRVPSFKTIVEAKEALRKKDSHEPADLYPRDGTLALVDLEERVSELVGIKPGHLLLYTTGMSALVDALEVRRPTVGGKILHGQQLYSKAKKFVNTELGGRGVRVAGVDSGSAVDIEASLNRFDPDIVLFETVSNGPDMPVLDIEKLFDSDTIRSKRSLVILDHTLPTASLLPPVKILEANPENLLFIESGTKFYGLNGEMAGLAYTYDKELLEQLKDRRQTVGSLLSASAVETIAVNLPSKAQFNKRNRKIASNTYRLAVACAQGLEGSSKYEVVHPFLSGHPNNEYTRAIYRNGGAPVFFINLTDAVLDDTEQGHFILADILKTNPVIHELVELRQSFGFNETSMWPDSSSPSLRVAGGVERGKDMLHLERAFKETLALTRNRKVFVNGFGDKPRVFSTDGWEINVGA